MNARDGQHDDRPVLDPEVLQARAANLDEVSQTQLVQIVSNVEWRDAFEVGAGVDVVTGNQAATAVRHSQVGRQKTKGPSIETFDFVSDSSKLNREIEGAVSGAYNTLRMGVGNSNSYLQRLEYSALSVTLLAKSTITYQGFDRAESFELTDEAKKLIADPATFRKQYGDYFIAGSQRQSTFVALYHCTSRSEKSLRKFKTSVQGSLPLIFSAKGSSHFTEEASKYGIEINIEVFMSGYEGSGPPTQNLSPKDVIERLNWFNQHEVGAPRRTLLHHYSVLDPSYPRTIDISPQVFVELRKLYREVWAIRSRFAACPGPYKSQLEPRFNALDDGVDADQPLLPTHPEMRRRYTRDATRLRSDLRNVFSRMDLYFKVREARHTEPSKGTEITSGEGGQQSWMYGYRTYLANPEVEISEYHHGWRHPWTEDAQHTFRFGGDQEKLIVGWKVISRRTDGLNGYWWKDVDTILGSDRFLVTVENSFDRFVSYGVEVYWVEAKNYLFETHAD